VDNNIFNNIYLGEKYAYLRPYISKRNPYDSKVFLVGINPATPITPIQLNIDEYIGLLKNLWNFILRVEKVKIKVKYQGQEWG
jgi:hypothetical protein